MKKEFFYYIGLSKSLKSYKKSYELVFLKSFLYHMDTMGKARAFDVAISFKAFYQKYKLTQMLSDVTSNYGIGNIENCSIKEVLKVIKYNPYRFINEKGFISIIKNGETEYFLFNSVLMSEFTEDDFLVLKKLLDDRLNSYFEIIQDDKIDNVNVFKEINYISQYIESKGFSYEQNIIENFYLCLKSKPFVILAGTSGTGKTKLVKLFAEAIGATSENNRYKLIPVHPDWTDSTDLLGHIDLNGEYISGVVTEFVMAAVENQNVPYFLCLDEMNLARVEYYFSDILSIMETRYFENKTIRTDKLIPIETLAKDKVAIESYAELYLPENLYIIGTVNMDETTFPFSKKVLDRANIIEFSYIDLSLTKKVKTLEPHRLENHFLKSEYLVLGEVKEYENIISDTISCLKKINIILLKGNTQIGYRIRDEICFYMVYNQKYNLMEVNNAMDFEILQKILPRIQGSSYTIKDMLTGLFKICIGSQNYYNDEDIINYINKNNSVYPKSAEKLSFMMRRFEEDGFTSYWL